MTRLTLGLAGGLDDGEHLLRRDVAGGEDHVVLGDDLHALDGGVGDFAVDDHPDRVAGDALLAHGASDSHPVGLGLAVVVLAGDVLDLVLGVDGGEPDDLVAEAAGDVDGEGVHAAHGVVEDEAAEGPDLGEHLVDEAGAVSGADVVGLEHHARHAGLDGVLGEDYVVELARKHVGLAVDVHVVRAADQFLDSCLIGHGLLLSIAAKAAVHVGRW